MRAARFYKKISQAQMADLVGTTQSTYSRIESGLIQKPDKEVLMRISEVLQISTEDILAENASDPSARRTQQTLEPLNPKNIPTVLLKLKKLVDQGVIEEHEFEEKKKELLARL
jgi:transcriptional regulator with XRE-family HTH domain